MECSLDKCPAMQKALANEIEIRQLNDKQNNFSVSFMRIETLMTDVVIPQLSAVALSVKELTEKPARRWEAVIGIIIGLVVMYAFTSVTGG